MGLEAASQDFQQKPSMKTQTQKLETEIVWKTQNSKISAPKRKSRKWKKNLGISVTELQKLGLRNSSLEKEKPRKSETAMDVTKEEEFPGKGKWLVLENRAVNEEKSRKRFDFFEKILADGDKQTTVVGVGTDRDCEKCFPVLFYCIFTLPELVAWKMNKVEKGLF